MAPDAATDPSIEAEDEALNRYQICSQENFASIKHSV